jgi:hypothetical protein
MHVIATEYVDAEALALERWACGQRTAPAARVQTFVPRHDPDE